MSDKPKRKRSEIAELSYSKRALRWLTVIYSLFLLPYFIDIWYFIPVFITLSVAAGFFWIGNYFVSVLSKMRQSLIAKVIALLITFISVVLLATVLTICAIIGFYIFLTSLSPYISFSRPLMDFITAISGFVMLLAVILIPAICFSFTLELLAAIKPKVAQTNKHKNVAIESAEQKLESEPNLSLELFTEADSAKQKMK